MRKTKKFLALLTALSISASAFAGLVTTAFAEGEYYTQDFEQETARGTDNNKTGDKQADDLTLGDGTKWHSFYGAGFMSIVKDSNPNINLHYQYALGSSSGQRGAYYIPNEAVKTVDDNKRSVLEMDFSMSTKAAGSQLVLTNSMDLTGSGNSDEGKIPTNSNYSKDYVIALYQKENGEIYVATLDGNDAPATLTGYTSGAWAHLKAVMDFNEDTVVIEITSLDGETTFLEETKIPMKGDNTAPGALVVSQPRNSSAKTGIDNIVFRPYADGDIKGTYYMATIEIDGKTISKTADKTTGLIDGVEDPTKTGYLFKGWAKDGDKTPDNLMTTKQVLETKLTADVTYTAVFEEDEDYIEPMVSLEFSSFPEGGIPQMSESADEFASNPIQVKLIGELGNDLLAEANRDERVKPPKAEWKFKGFRTIVSDGGRDTDENNENGYCNTYAQVVYDNDDPTKADFQQKMHNFNFYGEVEVTVTYGEPVNAETTGTEAKTLTIKKPMAILPNQTATTGVFLPKPGYVANFDLYADEMVGYKSLDPNNKGDVTDIITGGWASYGGNSGRGLYIAKDETTGNKFLKLKATGTNSSCFAVNKLNSAPTSQVVVEQDIKFYNANSSLLFKQDYPTTWSGNATSYSINFNGNALDINGSKIADAQAGVWYKIVASADVTSKLCYAKVYDMEGKLLGESDIVPFTNAGATAPTYLCYRTPDNANGELDFNNVNMYVPQIDGELITTISNDTLIIPTDIVLKDGINYDGENKKVIVKKALADDTEAILVAASYRGGTLAKVASSPLTFKDGQATAENIEVSGKTKFMVWNSLDGMEPVCDAKTVEGTSEVANTATLTVDAKSTEGYNIISNAEWTVVDAATGEASDFVTIIPDADNTHNATLTVAKGAAAGTYNVNVAMGGKTKQIPVTVTGTQDSVKFTKSTSSIGIPLEEGASQTYEYSAIAVDSENNNLNKSVTLAMYDKNNVNPLANTEAISFNAETGVLTVTAEAESTVVYIRAMSTNSEDKPITRSLKVTIHGLAFDFGAEAADGYTEVTPTTSYNDQAGYGISSGTTQVGGTGSLEDADSDYVEGAFTFQAKVEPKKVYAVTVKGLSTNFTAEKVVAGLTGAASSGLSKKENSDAYLIAVTDDILDLTFAAGSKVSSITIEKQPDKNPGSKPTIFTVGDSTLSNNGSWAYVISYESFPTLTDVAYFQCNGQGSQNLDTFYNGGQLMSRVLVNIAPGDYVTIGNMGTNGEGVNFEQAFNAYVDACEAMGAKVIINSYSPHGAVGGYASCYDSEKNTFEGYRKDNYDNIVRRIYEERTTEGGEKYDPAVVGFMDIGKMADAAFNAFVADYAGTTMKFAVGEQGTKTAYADKDTAAKAIIACFGDHNHYGDGGKGFDRLASNLMVRGYEAVGEYPGAIGIVNRLIEIVSADLAKTAE